MTELTGFYFDGKQPVAIPAVLRLNADHANFSFGDLQEQFKIAQLIVSPAIGQATRFINLPNGGQFSCENGRILDSLPQESPSEGPVFWLETRWAVALVCVVAIAIALAFGYFRGLPIVAERLASNISPETERAFGEQVIKSLDQKWTKPTQLEPEVVKEIQSAFALLIHGLPNEHFYRLELRDVKVFGPNAFALPGNIIVMTDDLARFAMSTDEIIGVLAHEIGHEEHHHALRLLLQGSAIGVLAGAITHDAATIGGAVTGAPILVAQMKYSRDFEAAADDYAFELLKQRGFSPLGFSSIMERFADKQENARTLSFLSSHPPSTDRARKAHDLGMDFTQGLTVMDHRMSPEIQYGQKVKVVPMSAVSRTLRRGDIVATYTKEGGFALRRIVGFPFDSIKVEDRNIIINGHSITGPRLPSDKCDAQVPSLYAQEEDLKRHKLECHFEISNSGKYITLSDFYSLDSLNFSTVPKGNYFAPADNRITTSTFKTSDSALIPFESVVGVVEKSQ